MSTDICSDERAKDLAVQLKEMIEKYYPEPSQSSRHDEMNALQAEIEKLGFRVVREIQLAIDPETGNASLTADIMLYRRENAPTSH
jgi:hypothetical protein